MLSQNILSFRPRAIALVGLVGIAFALSPSPVQAQQSEIDLLRQQIAELQARLDKVESGKIDAKPLVEKIGSSSRLPVTVSGLLQVQALAGLNGDQLSLAQNNRTTTRLRRGEIRVTAPTITNNISGTVMFDLAKTTANGTASALATAGTERNAILQELMVSWAAKKSASANHTLDIGQFKVPFGFEGDLVSSGALQTVERAQFFRSSIISGGGNNNAIRTGGDQREQGVRLRGNFGEISYDLGGFLGLGERQNAQGDFDASKAFAARLIYRPKALDGLGIGASYATGGLTGTFAAPFAVVPVGNTKLDREFYNAFAVYRKDKLNAQAEYFDTKVTASNGVARKGRSYYAGLGYLFTPQLEGVIRYDTFDTNRAVSNAKTTEALLGLNYYIRGNNAKVQTNLVRVKRPTVGTLDPESLELRAQFQVGF